jgi:hypothetical protein
LAAEASQDAGVPWRAPKLQCTRFAIRVAHLIEQSFKATSSEPGNLNLAI